MNEKVPLQPTLEAEQEAPLGMATPIGSASAAPDKDTHFEDGKFEIGGERA